MFDINFSEKELETLILGLQEREDRMYRDSEEYKKQENKVAQMDCLNEMKTARSLRQRLEKITTK